MARRRIDFFRLEDRIMLSADAMDAEANTPDPELVRQFMGASADADAEATNSNELETEPDGQDASSNQNETASAEPLDLTRPIEVVFVDAGVDDAQTLLDDLRDSGDDQTQWVIFEIAADRDGVEQIADALETMQSVDAIHLVSHGDGEGIQLGNTRLDLDSASAHAGEIASWGHALDTDADLLIYGCDLASTEDGQILIEALAALCNCDVAASDDKTGHEELGGDWVLEFQVGEINTDVAFSYAVQSSWESTLATITVTTTADENDGDTSSIAALQATSGGLGISLREAIIAANNTAGADTIILGSETYILDVAGQYEAAAGSGDLDITSDITLSGVSSTATLIDASGLSDRQFEVHAGGSLTISNMTLTGGGAINMSGGAVHNAGTFTATDVVFTNNSATNVTGGSIHSAGATTLNRVSLINSYAAAGGGIYVNGGTTSITNSTISGNQSEFDGGGISITSGTLNLEHVTVANNSTINSGNGGGLNIGGGTVNTSYSIFADNTSQFGGNDVNGNFVTGGYNIIEHNSGFTGAGGTDIVGSDPGLSTLTLENGTYVHTISSGSIAEDAATGSTVTVDQRGISRSGVADIGAFENSSAPNDATLTNSAQGGISINDDGGNDAYFVADDGGAVVGGLSSLTAEFRFSSTNHSTGSGHWFTLVSYDATGFGNELVVFVREDLGLVAKINDTNAVLGAGAGAPLFDGEAHTLSFTWDSTAGDWEFFIDGVSAGSGTGLASGYTLAGGGELVFGQEQDGELSGWNRNQSFSGTYYDARIFNEARSAAEIRSNYRTNLPFDETGMVANWQFDNLSPDGTVTEVVSGNNLTLQHATGTGYTASTPTLTLAVDENAV